MVMITQEYPLAFGSDVPELVLDASPPDGAPAALTLYYDGPSPGLGTFFGASLASGDFDGDGHNDLAVGAYEGSISEQDQAARGVVYLFYGSLYPVLGGWEDRGVTSAHDARLWAGEGDQVGRSLASADLDGDGRDDLIIGAPGASCSGNEGGAVWIVLGRIP